MEEHDNSKIYVQTPLIESIPFQEFSGGRRIFLKLENAQPSGSFKMRGISVLCKHAKASGFSTVVCCSSGNAGLATAYCARALDLGCHIIVFKAIPEEVRGKIRAYGATVEEHGTIWDQTYDYALKLTSGSKEKFLVHPFNHPLIWAGHATMVEEIKQDLCGEVPSIIVTVCGGGGLVSGLVKGLRDVGWAKQTKVLVIETVGAASFNASVQAGPGKRVKLAVINSIASSLITEEVCEQIVADFAQNEPPLFSRVVSDGEAVEACFRFANDHRMIVGPACGAGLAAVYSRILEGFIDGSEDNGQRQFDLPFKDDFEGTSKGPVVVIVCGGAEMTFDLLQQLKKKQ